MAGSVEDNSSTLSPTQKVMQYWKSALATLVTAGAIATCVYFPPAALYLSPAVEFLVSSLGLTSIWAGFAAFVSVVAGIAAATFGATRLLLEGVDALVNKCFGHEASDNNDEDGLQMGDVNNSTSSATATASQPPAPPAPDCFGSMFPPKAPDSANSPPNTPLNNSPSEHKDDLSQTPVEQQTAVEQQTPVEQQTSVEQQTAVVDEETSPAPAPAPAM